MFIFSLPSQATALIDYHIHSHLSTTFLSFRHFLFSKSVPGFQQSVSSPAAAKPRSATSFLFYPVPSAMKTILSSPNLIVNVFLVFYLFHAIQTIWRFSPFKRNNCRIFSFVLYIHHKSLNLHSFSFVQKKRMILLLHHSTILFFS